MARLFLTSVTPLQYFPKKKIGAREPWSRQWIHVGNVVHYSDNGHVVVQDDHTERGQKSAQAEQDKSHDGSLASLNIC
jgi:hypothetical protein